MKSKTSIFYFKIKHTICQNVRLIEYIDFYNWAEVLLSTDKPGSTQNTGTSLFQAQSQFTGGTPSSSTLFSDWNLGWTSASPVSVDELLGHITLLLGRSSNSSALISRTHSYTQLSLDWKFSRCPTWPSDKWWPSARQVHSTSLSRLGLTLLLFVISISLSASLTSRSVQYYRKCTSE